MQNHKLQNQGEFKRKINSRHLFMIALGELATAMPVTGSFGAYATKFISPATGFTVTWL
ncbi:hypothetical protein CCAL12920_05180 [Campylobacter sp. RM12920]|uniref:Amino acid permease/ SLC12A domain-containing protein n=1 Tax=Campylobacter californiensis TaxID=1032243 RepID=A0ABD4JGZ6_9BACT|nr:hypothetical protein [Campylobacter sp. RM12919]MBE2988290.1 hypothetical protein [Campylobacter sp. RM12920]